MINNNLNPKNITDIIDNIELYIDEMRKTEDDESIPKQLKQYAWEYFREIEISKEKLEKLAIFIIDKTYRVAADMTMVDRYTKAFFAKVIPFFWDTFQGRGIDIFYIVDNTFKDDGKFESIVELFEFTGMAVIIPYSKQNDLKYEEVKKLIKDYMEPLRMIFYLEKNTDLNYLDRVIKLAKESKYLCIFRNTGSNDSSIEVINSNYITQ